MKRINLLLGISAIIIITAGITYAQPVTKPHTFVSGNPANAEDVNENFDVVYDKVNQLDSKVCTEQTNKWLTVGASSFTGTVQVNVGSGENYWYLSSGKFISLIGVYAWPFRFYAPVSLPVGAVIQSIRMYAVDNSDTQDISCNLNIAELPDGLSGHSGIVSSSGPASTSIQTWEIDAASYYNTVTTPFHYPQVSCSWTGDAYPSNISLYGVSIEYSEPATCQ